MSNYNRAADDVRLSLRAARALCCVLGLSLWIWLVHAWAADPSTIPAAYSNWSECQLVSLVYPAHDCATHGIDKEHGAQLLASMSWGGKDARQLLVMIETYEQEGGQRPTYGVTEYSVDLVLFDDVKGTPVVRAVAKALLAHGGHGTLAFDHAVYSLNDLERAVAIRHPVMHQGLMTSHLYLVRQEQSSFRMVFNRSMERGFDMRESAAPGEPALVQSILQVMPRPTSMNDFKIVTRHFGWSADDSVDRLNVLRRTTELWRWDDADGVYRVLED